MFKLLLNDWRDHLWERLLDVPPEFFDGKGERPLTFGFWWRGPMLGEYGAWQNWLLGIIAVALLAFLWGPAASRLLHRVRVGVAAAAVTLIVPLLVPVSLGLQWWTSLLDSVKAGSYATALSSLGAHWWAIAIPLVAIGLLVWFLIVRDVVATMVMGRLASFGLLLMVICGTWGWNLTLGIAAVALIIDVYRKDARSTGVRITLATFRCLLIAIVLLLLNRPYFQREITVIEPSVVAILIDDKRQHVHSRRGCQADCCFRRVTDGVGRSRPNEQQSCPRQEAGGNPYALRLSF